MSLAFLNDHDSGTLMLEPTYSINETYTRSMPLNVAMATPGVAELLLQEGCYGSHVEVEFCETPQGRFPVSVYSWVG